MGLIRWSLVALGVFAFGVSLLTSLKVLIGNRDRSRPDYADPGLPSWTRRTRRRDIPLPLVPASRPTRQTAASLSRLAWAEDTGEDEWAPSPSKLAAPSPLPASLRRGDASQQRTALVHLADSAGAAAGATIAAASDPDPFASSPGGRAGHLAAAHHSNGQCWEHFDFGMLEAWDAQRADFCVPPPGAAAATAVDSSSLVCRVQVDSHLPAPTAPHTMCTGRNVALDVRALSRSVCLVHRPGYKCDGDAVHYHYPASAIGGACSRQQPFHAGAFPRDHLMDIFTAWGDWPRERVAAAAVAGSAGTGGGAAGASGARVTLLVTREKGEHANLFHATSDFLNAFFTLHVAGVIDGLAGSRAGLADVQVLLLDEQTGPFDDLFWRAVFSPAHPVLRVGAMRAAGAGDVRFPEALFVPPGYSNFLLAHVMSEGDCHAGTQLLQSFRRFVLGAHGLLPQPDDSAAGMAASLSATPAGGGRGDGRGRTLRVTLISRRPYSAAGVDHTSFLGRQVANEEELLGALAAVPPPAAGVHVSVTRVDFALLPPTEQLALVADSDVLVGMHGAALTFALYMPPHAAVLELWPKPQDMWRCFEHASTMAGLQYERWANPDPAKLRIDAAGDYLTVDAPAVAALLKRVVGDVYGRVAARRHAAAAAADAAAAGGAP